MSLITILAICSWILSSVSLMVAASFSVHLHYKLKRIEDSNIISIRKQELRSDKLLDKKLKTAELKIRKDACDDAADIIQNVMSVENQSKNSSPFQSASFKNLI